MSEMENALKELLIYNDKNSEQTAKELIGRFGGFHRIAQTEYGAISELSSEKDAVMIKLLAALASRNVTDLFKFGREHTEEEWEKYLCALFFDASDETVYFFPVDSKGRVLSCELIGEGTVNTSEFNPRKIIEVLVKRKASRGIIAHNHPAGVAEPSEEDFMATKLIRDVMKAVEKELVYHYIVAGERVCGIDPSQLSD